MTMDSEPVSDDVRRMTENPRRAILSMSVPLTVAALVGYVQNFIDTAWCSGLGSSCLSALTLAGPMYWIIMDVGIGLGVGAATSVARRLGSGEKEKADSLASQSLVLGTAIALVLTVFLVLVCDPVLEFMADGESTQYCKEYVTPYFFFVIPIVLHGVVLGLVRAEGSGKKVLKLSLVSALINIAIDPVFIYVLGMGLTGAAVATGIAYVVPLAVALYWYFGGKTYVRPSLKNIGIKTDEMRDILLVGLPHMLELSFISVLMIPQNMLVMRTGGEIGVVLAMTPFKFVMLGMMPAEGLAGGMIPVTSATQGAKRFRVTKDCFLYTIGMTAAVSFAIGLFLTVAADPLVSVFTYTGDMAEYHAEMTHVLRLYGMITVWGGLTRTFSAVIQSLRKSVLATVSTFAREIIFILMYAVASTVSMDAIYVSMFTGMLAGAVMMGLFAWKCIADMRMEPQATMQKT